MPVNPIGPLDAKIVIVGEAPGEDEEKTGVPFIGKSGQLLNRMLNVAGISRQDVYITNVVKVRPPDNKLNRLHEIGVDLFQCFQDIRKELAQLQPNIIVAIGGTSMEALTGQGGILKLRGSLLKTYLGDRHVKVIPTIHPAYIARKDYSLRFFLAADLKKAKRESEFPEIKTVSRTFTLDPTFDQVIEGLRALQPNHLLSIDIESNKPFSYIKCIAFTNQIDECICVPFTKNRLPLWHVEEEIAIWEEIKKLLNDPSMGKIAQNMNFELETLYPWVGEVYPMHMDTMLAQGLAYPEIKKDLGTITSLYTNEPYFKDDAKEGNYEGIELWRYNCMDTTVTLEVVPKLETELEEIDLVDFFYGYSMPLAVLLWRASKIGILIDQEKCNKYIEFYNLIRDEKQAELNTLLGAPINVNSPPQVKKLIYKDLGCKAVRVKGKVGGTDEETLYRLSRKYAKHRKLFNLILDVRKNIKVVSTFLTGLTDKDGRVHTIWKVQGTETGRLASSKNIRRTGLNMQNLPKKIRDIFIASPNKVFIVGDMSQVEARLVAYLSEDASMMNIFETGVDIHTQVAAWTYNVAYEDVDKKSQRDVVKHVVHGANYDIGPRTFAYKVDIPESEAKFLLNKYHNMFPGIRLWYKDIVDKLSKDRTLTTPFGRRRLFNGWWGENMFREAYANIPQGTAVDIINMAAVRIDQRLPKSANILIQVHDELVIECEEKDAIYVSRIFKEEVEKPININGHVISIPLKLEMGKNWKDTKKVEL